MAEQESQHQPVARRSLPEYGALYVYDLLLASLFFIVVLSPFAINVWLNWIERAALWHEAEEFAREMNAAVTE